MAISAVLGVTLVALVAEALLQPVAAPAGRNQLEHFLLSAVFAWFVVNGVMVVWHRPRNPIGWILVGIGGSAVWTTPLTPWGEHLLDSAAIVSGLRATTAATFGASSVGVVVAGEGAP